MPPLASHEMSERPQDLETDVEKQQDSGDKQDSSSRDVPRFVLTIPNERLNETKPRNSTSQGGSGILPLPASRYRYTKWHDIQNMEVKGNMLRSPRIRRAPKGYNVSTIHKMEIQNGLEHATSQKRQKNNRRLHYQSKLESWETCEAVNLSYQELGHSYQLKQFLAVLQKLIRCESLQLMDNGLKDLSSIFLPRCKYLHLQRNFLSNLKKLPKAPMLEHLSLQQNNIESLDGIRNLRSTKIVSLTLRDNPIELDPHYRQKVFKLLPNLRVLDDIPKLLEDTAQKTESDTCCIS